jgi:CheY-like chemotaxis protein
MDSKKEAYEGTHPQDSGSVRVLVIDDDEDVRGLIAEILTSAGHLVTDTSSGIEAIEIFKKNDFDLILTDLEMPEMSGWEIARLIKKLSPDSMIVLITGWGETIDSAQLREGGIHTIINKPFRVDQILSLVGEAKAAMRCRQE